MMTKTVPWFVEQDLFVAFAHFLICSPAVGTSLKMLTVLGEVRQSGVHERSWDRSSQEGRAWQWGASLGFLEELNLDLDLEGFCVLTGRNQEGERRHLRAVLPGHGNSLIKVPRRQPKAAPHRCPWDVSPMPVLDAKIKQAQEAAATALGLRVQARERGREINEGTIASPWGEAGMAPGVIPAVNQV